MPGATAIGTVAMSISTLIAIPTSIETSIETRPNKTCSNAGKVARAGGSTTRSIAKAFRIGIREPPRNLTGQAPTMRSNRGNSFAVEPIREDRISREAMSAIVAAQAVSVIVAVPAALAVVNLAAAIASAQRTVALAEATWVAARVTAAAHSKALAAAATRHAPPAHGAARAGVVLAEEAREVVAADAVEVAAAGADKPPFAKSFGS